MNIIRSLSGAIKFNITLLLHYFQPPPSLPSSYTYFMTFYVLILTPFLWGEGGVQEINKAIFSKPLEDKDNLSS